jgi:hypothetical protein
MKFTRRELFVLVVIGLLAIPLALTPLNIIQDYEILILVVVLGPLGLMIATDPERKNK